ncbi:MAG: NAD(P)H-dependent oxidoreductase [Gammaproteobacteria bacterium]|nr:NAD(P)H-dependent oxidoreductase [Gammaproteobacteria bacterium]
MRVLIVYAHPEAASFNGAMKDTAVATLTAAGHSVVVSDLYAQGFNPVAGPADFTGRADPDRLDLGAEQAHAARHGGFAPDVQAELDKLLAADFLLLQFPFWWYSVPAILKGWIDRVFAYGVAYDFGRTWDRGVFRGRRAMLSFTTSAPPTSLLPDGRNGDLERTLWPLHAGVLALCGYDVLKPFVADAVRWVDAPRRAAILADFRTRLGAITTDEPLFFQKLEDYGPDGRLKPGIEPRTPGQHRGRRFHLD